MVASRTGLSGIMALDRVGNSSHIWGGKWQVWRVQRGLCDQQQDAYYHCSFHHSYRAEITLLNRDRRLNSTYKQPYTLSWRGGDHDNAIRVQDPLEYVEDHPRSSIDRLVCR
jgi:hypothetical protein